MNFLDFQKKLSFLPIISNIEIQKAFPNYDRNALTRWQKKGYIEKIRNGYYRFTQSPIAGNADLFFMANQIYHPSYISLQSAFSFYGFIPEGIFQINSISSKKRQVFNTAYGQFSYHHIKSDYFFGYRLEEYKAFRFKIADPAKAFLDFLYLNPKIKDIADFEGLRLDFWELQEKFDPQTFQNYLTIFDNKALNKRAKLFFTYLADNDVFN